MFSPPTLLRVMFVAVAATCFLSSATVFAQQALPDDLTPEQVQEYERQLNAILKTRRDEEKAFVAAIVEKVRTRKIPSQLVSTSFRWVQENRPSSKYPFIYFVRVLRLQAEKIGLADEIPVFEFKTFESFDQQPDAPEQTNFQRSASVTNGFLQSARDGLARLFGRVRF